MINEIGGEFIFSIQHKTYDKIIKNKIYSTTVCDNEVRCNS